MLVDCSDYCEPSAAKTRIWHSSALLLLILCLSLAVGLPSAHNPDPLGLLKRVTLLNLQRIFWSVKDGDFDDLHNSSTVFDFAPTPFWPNCTDPRLTPDVRAYRFRFWMSWMVLSTLVNVMVGTFVLQVPCGWCTCKKRRKTGEDRQLRLLDSYECVAQDDEAGGLSSQVCRLREEPGPQGDQDDEVLEEDTFLSDDLQRAMTCTAVACYQLLCFKMTVSAASTERLSSNTGLDWEGYAGLVGIAHSWLLTQAIALRVARGPNCKFPLGAYASASFNTLMPFVSDTFDSLKDAMFAALALSQDDPVLKAIGIAAYTWLFLLHIIMICDNDMLLELQGTYLSVLQALPVPQRRASPLLMLEDKTDEQEDDPGVWMKRQALTAAYQQSKPSRQKQLTLEEFPQGALAVAFSCRYGFSPMVVVQNMIIPAVRLGSAYMLRDHLARPGAGAA